MLLQPNAQKEADTQGGGIGGTPIRDRGTTLKLCRNAKAEGTMYEKHSDCQCEWRTSLWGEPLLVMRRNESEEGKMAAEPRIVREPVLEMLICWHLPSQDA